MEGFLKRQGIEDVGQITATALNSYVRHLEQEQFKAATISRNVASVRAFFHFLLREKMVEADVSENLKAPRVEKKAPGVLSMEEVEKLLEQPGRENPKEIRDRAMLELLYATGIRVSELIGLTMEDVNMQMSYIICHDRTRERAVPFGSKAREALTEYFFKARSSMLKDPEERALFVNCSGKPMSRQGFWKLVKSYAHKAGITEEITPPHPAPFFRGPSGGQRGGSAQRAGNAGTLRYFFHPDLCQNETQSDPGSICESASQRIKGIPAFPECNRYITG